jgi:hypothetical protein
MKRRLTIGLMAITLAILAAQTPAAVRVFDTARNFGRQFQSLQSARSLNPIQRVVLSLMLAR